MNETWNIYYMFLVIFKKKWHKHSKFFGFSIASVEQGCKYRCITVKCLALNCAMHNVHSIPATKCWEVIVRVWHHAAADVGDGNESFAFRVCLQRARLPQREAFFIPLLGGGGGLRGEVCSETKLTQLHRLTLSIAIKASLPDGVRLHISIFHFLRF